MWSLGCILCDFFSFSQEHSTPLFMCEDHSQKLVKLFSILDIPSLDEMPYVNQQTYDELMMMFCDQRARCLEGMLMGVKPQIAELVVKCLQYHPRRRMQLPQMRAKVKAMLGHKRRKTRSIHPPQERWWQSSTLPV